jgi:hypothetical protein
MNNRLKLGYIALALIFATPAIAEEGCASYSYSDGINVEAVEGGTKILATGSATVSFDDVDSIKDARTEAEMEAKALIAKFLSEGIQSDTQINKVVQESKAITAEGRRADRQELIKRVQSLRSSSQALLRGVVPLGSCYTKAREVRVSVGIKPGTIRAAGSMAGSISSSLSANPTPGTGGRSAAGSSSGPIPNEAAQGRNSSTEPHRGMNGWSDSERARKF